MIGNGYWSNGITVRYSDGRWSASVAYYDDGFVNDTADDGTVSTEGTLHTRYFLRDGKTADALTVAIDTVKADAERLGISWNTPGIGPFVYMDGDGENGGRDVPDNWRELVDEQARRLGWERLYSQTPAE
ncbi:MAG TPA: hypothetical protein VIP77_22615 [Jiangellaceae bacterium]